MRPLALAVALLLAAAPAARGAELPKELPELEKEGERWYQEAGKPDLSESARNEARKKALVNLKKARDILLDHGEKHPEDETRLQDRLQKVGTMFHWIKKESPLSVLEDAGLAPKRSVPAAPVKPAPPPPSGNPFDKPPDAPEAAPVAAPPAETLEKAFAAAEAWAKAHKGDLAGVMERYQALLAKFPTAAGHPLYIKAAERAGQASAALKDFYRTTRDSDPDSLKNVDSDEVVRTVLVLKVELANQDAAVRERAAKTLGLLGSGEAVYPLSQAMKKETEEQTVRAVADALVAIGGQKAAEQVAKLRDEKSGARALDVLQRLTAKNPVDRRLAVKEIGRFAMAKDAAVSTKAVDFLVGLGAEGANGLVEALDSNRLEIRLKVIPALGATGNPKVARPLSNFLLGGDNPNTVRCREVAAEAIKSLGEPAVPYLFHGLRSPDTKIHTGFLLFQITGQRFSSSRPGDWVNWWKSKHPDWKDEG